jgi:NADH dehydrogenase
MPQRIVILGGTGFVGSTLCEMLFRHNTQCRLVVPTRRRVNGRSLQLIPTVDLVTCDVHQPQALTRLLQGADAVVNLVAILHGTEAAFDKAHVQLPRHLVQACHSAGIQRLVHVSALGVDAHAPSMYLRSKAAGEAVLLRGVQTHDLDLTILRPSVIFGAQDKFTNLFASLQRSLPVLPLAGAHAMFQPVWVGDVAQAIVNSLGPARSTEPVIECAGPQALSLAQIVRLVGQMAGHPRPIVPLPESMALTQASLMSCLPGEPLMSRDNVLSMRTPNVASGLLPGLDALGITPAALETLAGHFNPPRR